MTAQNDPRPASPVGGEALKAFANAVEAYDESGHGVYYDGPPFKIADIRAALAALSAPSVTGEAVASGINENYRHPCCNGRRQHGHKPDCTRNAADPVSAHEGGRMLDLARIEQIIEDNVSVCQCGCEKLQGFDLAAGAVAEYLAALSPTAVEERCARMEQALLKWDCGSCNDGKYLNWTKGGYEAVDCKVCDGTGLNPIARQAIGQRHER
jgi:hypothetical protein